MLGIAESLSYLTLALGAVVLTLQVRRSCPVYAAAATLHCDPQRSALCNTVPLSILFAHISQDVSSGLDKVICFGLCQGSVSMK